MLLIYMCLIDTVILWSFIIIIKYIHYPNILKSKEKRKIRNDLKDIMYT